MSSPIRILYIEDSEDDQILTLRALKKESMDVTCKRVDTLADFERELDLASWDVVISDYNVPGMNVLETLAKFRQKGFDLPFILVSGTVGEEMAVQIMKAGAHDYVMKDNLTRLPSAITRELAEAQSRAEKRENGRALIERESQLRNQVAQQNALLAINRAVQEMTTPKDLGKVVRMCFVEFEKVGINILAVAIKRIIDQNNGVFAFYEIQPTGTFHQFTEQAPNLFRKWRTGETVYRPNLDHDMGGLTPQDRTLMSQRYGQQVNSILNVCFDLGVLSLLSHEVNPYDASQIAFLEQVVLPISVGMHRLQDMEYLDAVVRHLPEGICLLDSFHRVAFANPLCNEFLTQLGIDLKGKMPVEIDGLSVELVCEKTQTLPYQITLANEAGTVLDVVVRPTREGPAETSGWVVVFRDVTQELQAITMSQRQDRLASIGQLAAGIAHDFNNMLTVMGGFAQILEMNPDLDEQTKEDLAQISQQGQRGAHLVRQILDFSRDTDTERQPIDIMPFLKESVKLFQRTLPESISVTEDFLNGHYTILANVTQLQQVLNNLAINARDAMPDGGKVMFGAKVVNISRQERPPVVGMGVGEWLKLTVSDTGSGIDSETLDHIFDPFFTTKEVGKGTGLGLAQVYGLLLKHDGFIDVDSVVGQGTTFSLYFPVINDVVANDNVLEDIPSGNGETILVVEDNDNVLESLRKMLTHLNYHVIVASSVEEAWPIIVQPNNGVDAVLTDLIMPGLGGLDLFERMRAQSLDVPLSIMTGYPSEAQRLAVRAQETCGVILKPLEVRQVALQVKSMLEKTAV